LGWETLYPDWAERNRRLGASSIERTVTAIEMGALIEKHGTPYYVKIDIEGADMVAVNGLAVAPIRPKFVSVESNKTSFLELRREFADLQALGYDRFKVVPQLTVTRQRLPRPPREGAPTEHRFPYGASGAFGEEVPGDWLTAEDAIEAYRPIFLRYALVGDDPLIRSKWVRRALWFSGYKAGWYDTHAKISC
jgi:hypothetical protein